MFKVTIKIAPSNRMKLLSSSHDIYVTETKSFTFATTPLLLSDLYKKFSTKFCRDMYLV